MKRIIVLIACTVFLSPLYALEPNENDVFVRVIDSGAALCCVVQMPGPMYMIYDGGNYVGGGAQAFTKIKQVIKADKQVELLVISHADADHLGAVDEICDAYDVKRVLRSGYWRLTTAWFNADRAIEAESENEGCTDINLSCYEYPHGATYRFSDVFIQMVCGFHKPPADWDIKTKSEHRNAGSIVVRLTYKGKSILFCGDTVGRHSGQAQDIAIAAEKFMIENSEVIKIDSDVIIAPHHGADNASSTAFINAVSPEFVVFSAGHKHDHPRKAAAERYISAGVNAKNMYRTDLKDDEGPKEWDMGRVSGHSDLAGDDDVDIVIRENGTVEVEYREEANQQYHNQVTGP